MFSDLLQRGKRLVRLIFVAGGLFLTQVLTVVCAKWGNQFSAEYVNRLYRAVLRNSARQVNFICVTDDPASIDRAIDCRGLNAFTFQDVLAQAQQVAPKKNGAYKKIAMFEPSLLDVSGPVLALDLDVVITGCLDPLVDFAPGHVVMPQPFTDSAKRPTYGEGSVIKFEPENHGFLFADMARSPAVMVAQSRGSEQSYTSASEHRRGLFSLFPRDWVASFKRHCRPARPLNAFRAPKEPESAKIVCFHGRPNIDEAIDGFAADFLHKTLPAPWIKRHWK
jgi:hypothetical protein